MRRVQIHGVILAGFLATILLQKPCLAQEFPYNRDEMYDLRDMSNLNSAEQQNFFKRLAADPILKQLVVSEHGESKDSKLYLNLPDSIPDAQRSQFVPSQYQPEVVPSLDQEFKPKIKIAPPPMRKPNSKFKKSKPSKLETRKNMKEKYGERKFFSKKPPLLMPPELTEEQLSRLRFPNSKFCTETSLKPADQFFLLPWWYHYCRNIQENKNRSFKNKKVLNQSMFRTVLEKVQAYKNSMKKKV